MAWVRNAHPTTELVIASDSRLTGGHIWDTAPKILPLPRGDSAIAFAGPTELAYPIMLQLANAIASSPQSVSRQHPLEKAKGDMVAVINRMLVELDDPVAALDPSTAFFLLGGFSWDRQEFQLWTLHYQRDPRGFTFRPMSCGGAVLIRSYLQPWATPPSRRNNSFAASSDKSESWNLVDWIGNR